MPSATAFNLADLPALTDKVIFITGGTAGLGHGSVVALAEHAPAEIVFSGRNAKKAESLVAAVKQTNPAVKVTFLECDLASLASTQSAAHKFLATADRLDVLMCNAGIMATPPAVTRDGYEVQFATNHLGHALLIKLLLPLLERTPGARIVSLSSIAYRQAPSTGIEFATLQTPQASLGIPFPPVAIWNRYGQSKLANLLYPIALAKHHPSVTSVAVHPGIIQTGLFDGLSMVAKPAALAITLFGHVTPVEQGHYNQVWAAACPASELENGAYYEPVGKKVTPSTKQAKDTDLAERLYEWTQKALEKYD